MYGRPQRCKMRVRVLRIRVQHINPRNVYWLYINNQLATHFNPTKFMGLVPMLQTGFPYSVLIVVDVSAVPDMKNVQYKGRRGPSRKKRIGPSFNVNCTGRHLPISLSVTKQNLLYLTVAIGSQKIEHCGGRSMNALRVHGETKHNRHSPINRAGYWTYTSI